MKGTIRYLFWHGVPWKITDKLGYHDLWESLSPSGLTLSGCSIFLKEWLICSHLQASTFTVSPCGMCFPQTPDWLNPSLAGSLLRSHVFTASTHHAHLSSFLPTPSYSIFPPWISLFKALNYLVVFYVYYCLLSHSCHMGKVLYLLTCKLKKKKCLEECLNTEFFVNIYWTSEKLLVVSQAW